MSRLRATGWRWARRTARATLDALLPPQCLTCETPVGAPGQWCPACFRRMSFVVEPCCQRCGAPLASWRTGGLARACAACVQCPPPWRQARAALVYDDQSRRMLLGLKHGDRVELARVLAPHMARAGRALLEQADVLVPVPLHRLRLISRRYNQSALLADAVARRAARPAVLDALVRTRRTASLGTLSAAERRAETAGAFAVRPSRRDWVRDARVLLIDDVLTSGATASACAEALLAAGAIAVDVLVAARVTHIEQDAGEGLARTTRADHT